MDEIVLVEVGPLPGDLLPDLRQFLAQATDRPCRIRKERLDPTPAYLVPRGQYDSRFLLGALEDVARTEAAPALGVIKEDLGSAIFSFVFGESRLGGRAGVVSTHRLGPERYGLASDADLLRGRVNRVSLHEVGHLRGLLHCHAPDCVMRFSGVAEELDLLEDRFCPVCRDDFARGTDLPAPASGTSRAPVAESPYRMPLAADYHDSRRGSQRRQAMPPGK